MLYHIITIIKKKIFLTILFILINNKIILYLPKEYAYFAHTAASEKWGGWLLQWCMAYFSL